MQESHRGTKETHPNDFPVPIIDISNQEEETKDSVEYIHKQGKHHSQRKNKSNRSHNKLEQAALATVSRGDEERKGERRKSGAMTSALAVLEEPKGAEWSKKLEEITAENERLKEKDRQREQRLIALTQQNILLKEELKEKTSSGEAGNWKDVLTDEAVFNLMNQELTIEELSKEFNSRISQMKGKEAAVDVNTVKLTALVLRNVLAMNQQQLSYLFNKTQRLPNELLIENSSLRTAVQALEDDRLVFTNENMLLKKDRQTLIEKVAKVKEKHHALKSELKTLKSKIFESSKDLEIVIRDFDERLVRAREDYIYDLDFLTKQVQDFSSTKLRLNEELRNLKLKNEKLEKLSPIKIQEEVIQLTNSVNTLTSEKNTLQSEYLKMQLNCRLLEEKLKDFEENAALELTPETQCSVSPLPPLFIHSLISCLLYQEEAIGELKKNIPTNTRNNAVPITSPSTSTVMNTSTSTSTRPSTYPSVPLKVFSSPPTEHNFQIPGLSSVSRGVLSTPSLLKSPHSFPALSTDSPLSQSALSSSHHNLKSSSPPQYTTKPPKDFL
eukprot:TRINITY_DN2923_c0_g2_i2.p2 TRINITY_DN2923_c0_g2~~TRINITY_DN2923_c0_g2_i2.p2  ORF type:complete len:555 (+),score=143.06 TRINITY_DN2923_c0_g2_i2:1847-3511(+)